MRKYLIFALLIVASQSMAAEPQYIFSSHDLGGYTKIEQAGKTGWLVVTVGIGHNPADHSGDDFRFYSNRGHGVIVRINNGYSGDGTIPYQSQYADFATRCANYVAATQGADIFIIGNETNLPREWPGNTTGWEGQGEPITVARYVDCYTRCYNAIKAVRPTAQVCPSPSGTWSPPWPASGLEGFLDYWVNILNAVGASKVDALILHAYTHGCDPALVTDNSKMGPPYEQIFYNFRVYQNYMNAVPTDMRSKPVYITECDENTECADGGPIPKHTWLNSNNGWVKAIYSEINAWNITPGTQKIRCVSLFRWDDVPEGEWGFGFSNRAGVVTDWLEAMANPYRWDTMPTTGSISGTVTASGGTITGATVSTSIGGYSTTSGAGGVYTLSNVAPGTYSVTASKPGYTSQTQTGKTVIAGQVTQPVDFTLTALPPGAIAGRVKSGNTALNQASVTLSPGGYSALTAADGSYSISSVPAATYTVTASRAGYISESRGSVVIASSQTTTADFFLRALCTGVPANGDFESGFTGGVAAGWSVWRSPWGSSVQYADSTSIIHSGGHAQRWGRSDNQAVHGGIMLTAAVTAGTAYNLTGWLRFSSTDPNAWLELGYDPTGQTTDGEASSVHYTKYESQGQNTWIQAAQSITATGPLVSVFTKFGHVDTVGSGPCYAWADDITLCPVPTTGSLAGYVRNVSGNAISGATVSTAGGVYTATTGSDGGYFIGSVAPGTYTLTASAPGYDPQTATGRAVTAPQTMQTDFTLAAGPLLLTRISDAKRLADGGYVSIANLVCTRRVSGQLLFVQEPSRACGIKVTVPSDTLPALIPGQTCTVTGILASVNYVREISNAVVEPGPTGAAPIPFGLANRAVGGIDYFFSAGPPATGQRGSLLQFGPNNVGLLVRVWGQVKDASSGGVFHLSDGSGDLLSVKLLPGVSAPGQGWSVTLTGIAEPDGLLLVSDDDVKRVL